MIKPANTANTNLKFKEKKKNEEKKQTNKKKFEK